MRTAWRVGLLGFGLVCALVCAPACAGKGDDVADEVADEESGDGDGDVTGDGDGDGDPSCGPTPSGVEFSYEPFEFGGSGGGAIDVDWTCSVVTVDTSEGLDVELACPEWPTPVRIDVSAAPLFMPAVLIGDTLQVRYVFEGPFWFNTYLRLDHSVEGHLLTLIDGDSLIPEDYVFEPPIELGASSVGCEASSSFCGLVERLAIDVVVGGEASQLLDGSHALVGGVPGTDVWVVEAIRNVETQCTDTPDEWFRVLIAN